MLDPVRLDPVRLLDPIVLDPIVLEVVVLCVVVSGLGLAAEVSSPLNVFSSLRWSEVSCKCQHGDALHYL